MVGKPGTAFAIDYVSGTGKRRGELRRLMRVVLGRPAQDTPTTKRADDLQRRRKQEDAPIDYRKRYVDRGLLPVTDLDTGAFLTLKISHLVRFDLKRIDH